MAHGQMGLTHRPPGMDHSKLPTFLGHQRLLGPGKRSGDLEMSGPELQEGQMSLLSLALMHRSQHPQNLLKMLGPQGWDGGYWDVRSPRSLEETLLEITPSSEKNLTPLPVSSP